MGEIMVGIMADSHDNVDKIKLAVRFFNDRKCDLVVHAGDFVAPFSALALKDLNCPVKAVFGNCDGEKTGLVRVFEGLGEIQKAPLVFTHDRRKFVVTHLGVPAGRFLRDGACDVLIFGHTHKVETKLENGVRIINPGETGGWLHGKSTVGLLDTTDLSVEIVTIQNGICQPPGAGSKLRKKENP